MKSNNYNLSNDILTIKTNFGHYSFKIEDSDLLENAERIVKLMISEIDKVDTKLHSRREKSGQYARLLLANLNICEKYIQLEDKYIALTDELNKIKSEVESTTALSEKEVNQNQTPQINLTESDQLKLQINQESQADLLQIKPEPAAPTTQSALKPILQESLTVKPEPSPILPQESVVVQSTQIRSQPYLFYKPIYVQKEQKQFHEETTTELISVPKVEEAKVPNEEPQTLSSESTRHTYIANKPAIASWKLKHSYLALKKKAMERVMQAKNQSRDIVDGLAGMQQVIFDQLQNIKLEQTIQQLSDPQKLITTEQLQEPQKLITTEQLQESKIQQTELIVKHEPIYIIKQLENDSQYISKPTLNKPKVYKKGEFQLPNLFFLKNTSKKTEVDHHSIRRDAELLEKKLGYFGIKGEVMGVSPGPVITTFEYRPEPGIKISKIVNLADDLALALSAFSIRIVAPIPGKDVMGIEIPNIKKSLVPFVDIVSSDAFMSSKSKLPICLGKDIIGNPVVVELDKMPHLLIAGATGTGKSVGLNAMITSILYKSTPEDVRFLMIDPKRIELSFYNDIPHLLTPVIIDMKKATIALQWLVREMDRRYTLLAKSQVRHIEQYNQKVINISNESNPISNRLTYDDSNRFSLSDNKLDCETPEPLPYIVVIIDELADLMMTASKDIETSLTRLAQMARAAGIHLILATQRPSVDVLTGIIKANFPTRISFQVSSKTDSRTIIDANGAETLLGNGDMLFVPPGTARLIRVHGTYLSEDELTEITSFLKSQGKPEYVLDVITETTEEPPQEIMDDDYDDKYNEALEFVIATKQASISGIQRALRVGYNRAARIIDIMEKRGIVGPSDGVKPRRVIVENIEY